MLLGESRKKLGRCLSEIERFVVLPGAETKAIALVSGMRQIEVVFCCSDAFGQVTQKTWTSPQ